MRKLIPILLLLLIAIPCFAQQQEAMVIQGVVGGGSTLTGKSLLFTHDASTHPAGYVYEILAATHTEIYAEGWIRFSSVAAGGATTQANPIYLMTGVGGALGGIWFVTNAGGNLVTLKGAYYDDAASSHPTSVTISPSANIWYQWRIHWKASTGAGNNNGIFAVYWIDMGTPIISVTNADTDTLTFKRLNLGMQSTTQWTSSTLLIYYDDIKLGSTADGSDYFSMTWETATNPEDGWTGKTDAGSALSVSTTVFH